jgi:hypothetical protein
MLLITGYAEEAVAGGDQLGPGMEMFFATA